MNLKGWPFEPMGSPSMEYPFRGIRWRRSKSRLNIRNPVVNDALFVYACAQKGPELCERRLFGFYHRMLESGIVDRYRFTL